MKVGLVFECPRDGTDMKVCEHIIKTFFPEISFQSVGHTNKKELKKECGRTIKTVFNEDEFDRIVVVWDRLPPWKEKGQPETEKPSCEKDKESIQASLDEWEVKIPVFLVCIEEELEEWLIVDGSAVSRWISRPTRTIPVSDCKKPQDRRDPKTQLKKIYKEHRGNKINYNEHDNAMRIVRELKSLEKLIAHCDSFRYFIESVTGRI